MDTYEVVRTFSPAATRTSRFIQASPEVIYQAFTDPTALAAWLSPEGMAGKVHDAGTRSPLEKLARYVE